MGVCWGQQPGSARVQVHVATNGSDTWSGRLAEPNDDHTDGPFATLEHAVEAVRKVRSAGRTEGPARIVLHGGVCFLRKPVELRPEDSHLTIEGEKDKDVVISGGRRITGWKPWKENILQADLSKADLPDLNFRELYYNGKLMPWARVPNFDPKHPRTGGFLQNAGVVEPNTKTKFRYREGELHPEKWAHPERAWIMFHDKNNYETQYCPIKSIDPANRVVEASKGVYVLVNGNPFYLCGILEELDAPGEWCVDPDTKTLYFWPPGKMGTDRTSGLSPFSGNPNKTDQVIVPALQQAFVLKGDPDKNQWVENVRLAWLAVRDFRGRAIQMTGAKGCSVVACDLRNAEVGVYLGDDTHACRVVGCDITQTQGDGVSILGASMDHERVTDHVVDNCYIYDIGWGRIHNRCGGVYMHRCARVKLTHNHVHDTPRYALGMDVGNDCEFAYNYCHHSNLVTADTSIIEAATAMDWRLPIEQQLERNKVQNAGNTIHHNLLHDSGGWKTNAMGELEYPYYSWGIYLDVACSGWHIHDNVCYNTVLGGFMSNAGVDNTVENNIFVDGQKSQVYWNPWRKYPTSGNRFERNIIAYQGKPAVAYRLNRFQDDFVHFERNLLWANGEPPIVMGMRDVTRKGSWEAWLKRGRDEGSLMADPQFVDPAKRDYRLKPGSPAFKLGFKAIDLSTVGNYASPERRTWPRPEVPVVRDPADYTPKTSAARQPERRDYEDYTVGESERGAHVGNRGKCYSAVTDETAASGKHSLKFVDAAGLPQKFFPYITYPLDLEEGTLRMAFDLRWETGALMQLDWRDDPYTYNMGPNLRTSADGWLSANGKKIVQLPAGQWVHIEIGCGLGPQATGKYDLTIKLPDAEKNGDRPDVRSVPIFHVACSPQFKSLNCIVFMSVADGPTVFYIDNLELIPAKKR
ncbi:MAG: right-handed parallel beta-helix repeat-containing protein [Planctomycetes bacterium]|nr:right-handed parallel beta-helix repeat-containing protein [Planctomycetota bacterium]